MSDFHIKHRSPAWANGDGIGKTQCRGCNLPAPIMKDHNDGRSMLRPPLRLIATGMGGRQKALRGGVWVDASTAGQRGLNPGAVCRTREVSPAPGAMEPLIRGLLASGPAVDHAQLIEQLELLSQIPFKNGQGNPIENDPRTTYRFWAPSEARCASGRIEDSDGQTAPALHVADGGFPLGTARIVTRKVLTSEMVCGVWNVENRCMTRAGR